MTYIQSVHKHARIWMRACGSRWLSCIVFVRLKRSAMSLLVSTSPSHFRSTTARSTIWIARPSPRPHCTPTTTSWRTSSASSRTTSSLALTSKRNPVGKQRWRITLRSWIRECRKPAHQHSPNRKKQVYKVKILIQEQTTWKTKKKGNKNKNHKQWEKGNERKNTKNRKDTEALKTIQKVQKVKKSDFFLKKDVRKNFAQPTRRVGGSGNNQQEQGRPPLYLTWLYLTLPKFHVVGFEKESTTTQRREGTAASKEEGKEQCKPQAEGRRQHIPTERREKTAPPKGGESSTTAPRDTTKTTMRPRLPWHALATWKLLVDVMSKSFQEVIKVQIQTMIHSKQFIWRAQPARAKLGFKPWFLPMSFFFFTLFLFISFSFHFLLFFFSFIFLFVFFSCFFFFLFIFMVKTRRGGGKGQASKGKRGQGSRFFGFLYVFF